MSRRTGVVPTAGKTSMTSMKVAKNAAAKRRASKSKDTRYLHIHEDGQLDEDQLAAWVRQASRLPANECEWHP
ncbi:MAG: hypothetical protein V7608_3516 [Hyphomicrobiales bacterium]